MRSLLLLVIGLGLAGCAGGAIPIALYVTGGLGAATLAVTALHDCHQDGGCTYLPVPP